jgi:ERCC4-related helicase
MIELCGKWNPQTDQKLNELQDLLTKTHGKEKVLVFTQYSDTANYIYRQRLDQLTQRVIDWSAIS